MYEVSCHDLGVTDCDFDLMAYSLERLEQDVLTHARFCHPGMCAAVEAAPESFARRALHARIVAAAHVVCEEELTV
jgi:predicted small metal-binding protein